MWYFKIKFERKDGKEDFILTPNAFVNYKGTEGLKEGILLLIPTGHSFLRNWCHRATLFTLQSPILVSSKVQTFSLPDSLAAENLIFQLNKVEGENIELGIKETDPPIEYVTLKAYIFPFINLLGMGTFIMVAGLLISAINRITIYKSVKVSKKVNEKVPRNMDGLFTIKF